MVSKGFAFFLSVLNWRCSSQHCTPPSPTIQRQQCRMQCVKKSSLTSSKKRERNAKKGNEKRIFPLTFIFISYFVSIILFGIFDFSRSSCAEFCCERRAHSARCSNVCSTIFYETAKATEKKKLNKICWLTKPFTTMYMHSYRIDGDFLRIRRTVWRCIAATGQWQFQDVVASGG